MKQLISQAWPHIKGAYKSLTMWINAAFAVVVKNWDDIMQSYPQLGQYMNADHFKYLAGSIIVANIMLRFKTNKSLADK
jgi:hypothetical protein